MTTTNSSSAFQNPNQNKPQNPSLPKMSTLQTWKGLSTALLITLALPVDEKP